MNIGNYENWELCLKNEFEKFPRTEIRVGK